MRAYNRGSVVTRDDLRKEINETVPPFAFVTIGRAGEQTAARARHNFTVWNVGKPGTDAAIHHPGTIAVNGPLPIVHKGYGKISQDWPARVAIESSDLPDVHGSVGIADDSWFAQPGGGTFTVLGADPVFLSDNGAVKNTAGQWINLPDVVLLWIVPRGDSRPWAQGWGLLNEPPTIESLDYLQEEPLQSRLQQPYQGETPEPVRLFEPVDHATLWEPVLTDTDHEPESDEDDLPIKRSVEWIKVRETATYLIHFSAMIAKADYDVVDDPAYIGIGLFGAAWNEDTEEFEMYDQPAAIASRWPFRFSTNLNAEITGTYGYGYDWTVTTLFVRSMENVAGSAVVELKAGWAFGFLKIGLTKVQVEHLQWTAYRLGSAVDPESFWLANAGKVDWDVEDASPVDP